MHCQCAGPAEARSSEADRCDLAAAGQNQALP